MTKKEFKLQRDDMVVMKKSARSVSSLTYRLFGFNPMMALICESKEYIKISGIEITKRIDTNTPYIIARYHWHISDIDRSKPIIRNNEVHWVINKTLTV